MNQIADHKGYYRRRLPHIDQPGKVQALTFRLADSLPHHVIDMLLEEGIEPKDPDARARIEKFLNTGHGECWLRDPSIAKLVQDALLYFDEERYNLVAWVVMPNHVHVIIEMMQDYELHKIVHSWKSYTAHEANKILQREGQFWYREYFDRFIRDATHLDRAIDYIHNNPVNAGLVDNCALWPYSSFVKFYPEYAE